MRLNLFKNTLLFTTIVAIAIGCSEDEETEGQVLLEPGMVFIEAGEFIAGSNKVDDKGLAKEFGFVGELYVDEHPQHKVFLKAYQIDQYEVSNLEYKRFVIEGDYQEPVPWVQNGYNVRWEILERSSVERLRSIADDYFQLDADVGQFSKAELLEQLSALQSQRDPLPVTGVSWFDAFSYCQWREKRLPSEMEWEKAARGAHGFEYPWGNQWDETKTNTGEGEQELTVFPVGVVKGDKSPYDAFDMGGNVSEWTNDWYQAYPGSNYVDEAFGDIHRVVRGGGAGVGHYAISTFFRSARRAHADPTQISTDVGFRCAK